MQDDDSVLLAPHDASWDEEGDWERGQGLPQAGEDALLFAAEAGDDDDLDLYGDGDGEDNDAYGGDDALDEQFARLGLPWPQSLIPPRLRHLFPVAPDDDLSDQGLLSSDSLLSDTSSADAARRASSANATASGGGRRHGMRNGAHAAVPTGGYPSADTLRAREAQLMEQQRTAARENRKLRARLAALAAGDVAAREWQPPLWNLAARGPLVRREPLSEAWRGGPDGALFARSHHLPA